MDNKTEKFLPIGTVVLLEGGTRKAMITGFCSVSTEDKTKIYDYTGCIYPEGYLDFNQICLFNHEQIKQVFHLGYTDDEEKQFKKELQMAMEQYNNGDEELHALIEDTDEDEEDDDDDEEETSVSNNDASSNHILPSLDDSVDTNTSNDNTEYEYL